MKSRIHLNAETYRKQGIKFFSILHSEWKWRKTRNNHLKNEHFCQMCGIERDLQVHHIKPWHLFPSKRYDYNNLITLCSACHFRFGHALNWNLWNPNIKRTCRAVSSYLNDIQNA